MAGVLDGKVAIVTGAAMGIGRHAAHTLAQAGAKVAVADISDLGKVAGELGELGAEVLTVEADVQNEARVKAMVDQVVSHFGRIDILLNNAGIWSGETALKFQRSAWDKVLASNLTSVFFLSQLVALDMAKRGEGKIINISSTSGVRAHEQGAAYGASKAALIHLTKILAVEWGDHGIRVTGIAPGLFRTDMTREEFGDHAWVSRRLP